MPPTWEQKQIQENLLAAMACYAAPPLPQNVQRIGSLQVVYSGKPGPVFNTVQLTEPLASESECKRQLLEADAFFRAHNARWSFWLVEHLAQPTLLARIGALLRSYDLAPHLRSLAMVAQALAPPRRALATLEFRRVLSVGQRFDFSFVMSRAFDTALPLYRDAYEPDSYWQPAVEGWVGYAQGRAVAAATTVSLPHSIGLYGAAVLPEEQGRGLGEAIVRHALTSALARVPHKCLVLEASRAAAPLYRRLGFAAVGRVSIYNEVSGRALQ